MVLIYSCSDFTLGAGGPSFYDSILESEVCRLWEILLTKFVTMMIMHTDFGCRWLHGWLLLFCCYCLWSMLFWWWPTADIYVIGGVQSIPISQKKRCNHKTTLTMAQPNLQTHLTDRGAKYTCSVTRWCPLGFELEASCRYSQSTTCSCCHNSTIELWWSWKMYFVGFAITGTQLYS